MATIAVVIIATRAVGPKGGHTAVGPAVGLTIKSSQRWAIE